MPDKACGGGKRPTIAQLEEILDTPSDKLVILPDGSVVRSDFRQQLGELINKFSMENGCNTPDFILAEYLCRCLNSFDDAVKAREKWYLPEGLK